MKCEDYGIFFLADIYCHSHFPWVEIAFIFTIEKLSLRVRAQLTLLLSLYF